MAISLPHRGRGLIDFCLSKSIQNSGGGGNTFLPNMKTSGPTPSGVPGSSLGTEGDASVSEGTDNSGKFSFTTGAGATTGPQIVVTFASPYAGGVVPNVVFSRTDSQTVGQFYISSTTNTGFTLSASVAPSIGVTYSFTFLAFA